MHLAGAVGISVLGLFGPGQEDIPMGPGAAQSCAPLKAVAKNYCCLDCLIRELSSQFDGRFERRKDL